MKVVDLRIRTGNPDALDATMQDLGAVVVEGSFDGDSALVRCFGNAGFVRFACENQGYGEVIEETIVGDLPAVFF